MELVQALENTDECFLYDLVGVVLVVNDSNRDRESAPLMPLDQTPKGRCVSFLCILNQTTIDLRFASSFRLVGRAYRISIHCRDIRER